MMNLYKYCINLPPPLSLYASFSHSFPLSLAFQFSSSSFCVIVLLSPILLFPFLSLSLFVPFSISNVLSLNIDTLPVIVQQPQSVVATVGSEVMLECSAMSLPTPEITWIKDGTIVDEGSDNRIDINQALVMSSMDEVLSTLMIVNVSLSDDGEYSCNASNIVGSVVSNTVNLTVQGK